MIFWLILGVCMGWAELVYGKRDKVPDIPEKPADGDAYLETRDILVDIPEHLRAEPAVKEAERVVRSGR